MQASRLSSRLPLRILPGLALVAVLGACASPGTDYPSLALRDAERISGTMEVDPPPPPPPAPAAATLEQLPQLTAEARAAHAQFVEAAPAARSRVNAAVGASRGSDSWSVAQVAVADLEARRSRAMIALADLDRLYVGAFTAAEDITAIEAARGEVDALVQQQNAVITELLGRLDG